MQIEHSFWKRLSLLIIGIVLPIAFLLAQNINDGLFAYYNFCDCKGTDISGNGRHATIVGNPLCVRGKLDRGLWINQQPGSTPCGRNGGEFIQLPAMGAVWQNGFTVCAWVKFENPMSYERIIDLGNGSGESGGNPIWFGREGASNNLTLESWISTSSINRSQGRLVAVNAVTNGSIEYYCATVHEDTMRIYVNGKLAAEKKGHPILNVPRQNNYIGRSSWCDDDFKGFMDEIRIYNRALSPEEIASLYKVTNITDFDVQKTCDRQYSFSIPPSTLIDSVRWNYQHPNGSTVSLGKGYNVSDQFSAFGTYEVKAIVYKGCLNDTVVKPIAVIDPKSFLGADTVICEGSELRLSFTPNGAVNYRWQEGSVQNYFTVKQSGLYWLKVDVDGCAFEDSIKVTMIDSLKPAVQLTADIADICKPHEIILNAAITDGGEEPVINWLVNGVSAGNHTDFYKPAAVNNGDTIAVVLTVKNSCQSTVVSNIYPVKIDELFVQLQNDTTIIEGSQFVVNASYSSNIISYNWAPVLGLSNALVARPVAMPLRTTIYTVTVATAQGCKDSAAFTVTVLPDLKVPTAFSPNHDGVNDVWIIKGLEGFANAHISVFDRYGKIVYQSRGYRNPWNGKQKDKPLPAGVYYYVINTNTPQLGVLKGSVTVLY